MIDRTLSHFRILAKIGEGGMGTGIDPASHVPVLERA